jgi:uncharacterized coiled-coil DUF342 family protein
MMVDSMQEQLVEASALEDESKSACEAKTREAAELAGRASNLQDQVDQLDVQLKDRSDAAERYRAQAQELSEKVALCEEELMAIRAEWEMMRQTNGELAAKVCAPRELHAFDMCLQAH